MLQRACLRQGMSFCRALVSLKNIHSNPDITQKTVLVKLNQKNVQTVADLQKHLSPASKVSVIKVEDEQFARISFKSFVEADRTYQKLRMIGMGEPNFENKNRGIEYRQLVLSFPPHIESRTFINKELTNVVKADINESEALVTFSSELTAEKCFRKLTKWNRITVSFVGRKADEFEEDSRKRLWVICRSPEIKDEEITAMLSDAKLVYRYSQKDERLATVFFESEEEANRNYVKLLKRRIPGLEVHFVGKKRYEVRQKARLILHMMGPPMTKEEIFSLSDDILLVHTKFVNKGKSKAFLDFESEEVAERNFRKFLDMNLEVNRIGKKWLVPEDEPKALYVEFSEIGTTWDDVTSISPDISKFKLRRKSTGQTYAFLVFSSEELMERNFKLLESKGLFVDFVGQRRRKRIEETKDRTLYLSKLHHSILKEDVEALSEDIVKVSFKYVPYNSSFAYLEFATRESAEKNYHQFKKQGLEIQYWKDMNTDPDIQEEHCSNSTET